MEDNIETESENYRNTETYGYKDICLRQVQRVVVNLSREQREGFWVYSINPNGPNQKVRYIGDARKESIQSIETLYDLLLPRFDKQVTEDTKDFETIMNTELDAVKDKLHEAHDDSGRDKVIDEFWRVKRSHYRKLFQQLCRFLERLGWFEAGSLEDSD